MKVTNHIEAIIIHAPNVHLGGGLSLLQALLSASKFSFKWVQLDQRAKEKFQLPVNTARHYVNHSALSRLCAEWRLRRHTKANDVVLCFHGLPPLFPLRGRVIVLLQNRILVNQSTITGYRLRTKIRLLLERWILRTFSLHADKFIVQTPSMARDTKKTLRNEIDIVVLPFAAKTSFESNIQQKSFDFIYVADEAAHKNHATLLEAWCLLADAGMKPSLVLTVPAEAGLADEIEAFKKKNRLNINNLGRLQASEIHRLYRSSSALIFPSTTESLGLPLIEAAQHGLPILASELDYVRDVVNPVQTFDPRSPVSIARAVKRFLGKPESALRIRKPEDFWAEVLK
jgi:glycosyltransferase involved in cell wall biosynthesis